MSTLTNANRYPKIVRLRNAIADQKLQASPSSTLPAATPSSPMPSTRFSPKRLALMPAGTLSSIASRPYNPVKNPSCV